MVSVAASSAKLGCNALEQILFFLCEIVDLYDVIVDLARNFLQFFADVDKVVRIAQIEDHLRA